MAMEKEEIKRALEQGFGRSELCAVLRPIAMDSDRLSAFIARWNDQSVTSIWDIITTQFVTRSLENPVLPQNPLEPAQLDFSDTERLEIVRLTATGYDEDGDPIDLSQIRADLQVGTRSHLTGGPAPLSQIADNGINSWYLPVPISLFKQQVLHWRLWIPPTIDQITRLDCTLHAIRLTL